MASNDDRVSLGRADLAIREGSFDLAARLLGNCLRRRPDDVPVSRHELNWAMATNQLAMVLQALEHLPADAFAPAQIHKLDRLDRQASAVNSTSNSANWNGSSRSILPIFPP